MQIVWTKDQTNKRSGPRQSQQVKQIDPLCLRVTEDFGGKTGKYQSVNSLWGQREREMERDHM